jgi:ribose/xylose/arabinose/galactoside ABC-type transport system permease subunit
VAIGAWIREPIVFSSYQVTLGRIALIGLVALGLTVVILMGELDLSVASTLAVGGVVMASIDNLASASSPLSGSASSSVRSTPSSW